jgi:hypothetical protein
MSIFFIHTHGLLSPSGVTARADPLTSHGATLDPMRPRGARRSRSWRPPGWRGSTRVALVLSAPLLALTLVACSGGEEPVRVIAATPTVTPAATETPEPTPTPVPLPSRPDNPLGGALAVSEYLHQGEADIENCLPELVRAWNLAPVEGERCLHTDMDGDGRDEFVFLITLPPDEEGGSVHADLWFFDDERAERRFYHSGRGIANQALVNLEILEVRDFTGSDTPEIVATWGPCIGDRCTTHLLIASHHGGMLTNLAPSSLAVEAVEEITIDDENRIHLRAGLFESPGAASAPRSTTTVLSWAGSQFRAVERLNPPEFLIHLVDDADRAFADGDYATARQLFEQASVNEDLRDWKQESGAGSDRPELQAYALLRASFAAQRMGDNPGARELLEWASSQFSGTMHGGAANVYLVSLDQGRSPITACASVEAYLGAFPSNMYDAFWTYGPASQTRSIFTLCS